MRAIWENSPQPDTKIWRYFKTNRFIEFLETSKLHFASANQFQDRFEGSVAIQSPNYLVDPRYAEIDGAEKAFRELKRLTKISCWHCASFESDAMWKLYADFHKGVAIQTTPSLLLGSIAPFRLRPDYGEEDILAGEVRYLDLTQVRLSESMERRFFYKHEAFAWEQEYRLAISLRMAEESGVSVPEGGISLLSIPAGFIERIVIGPHLSGDDQELIRTEVAKVGLEGKIVQSSLLFTPRYI